MIFLKEGVKLHFLKPQMLIALNIAEWAFMSCAYDTIVTSCNDGKHKKGSKHYTGEAIDLRIKHVNNKEDLQKIYNRIKEGCGNNFDVILETDHIHIEYDPK